MRIACAGVGIVLIAMLASGGPVWAQAPTPTPAPTPGPAEAPAAKKEEEKPKTLWDEFKLFSYIENGYTFNLHGLSHGIPGSTSTGAQNLLRYYDINTGYTFNMAEFSIKRDPDEKFPLGVGLVLTAGQDSQKNHSIGILRQESDTFPFRNDPWWDLQEAYVSGRVPVGSGLVVKLGKFVTPIGYEVIESPSNLNYSRDFLFTLGEPFTHTGGTVSYTFTDWLSVLGGVVLGWDDSKNINNGVSWLGQVAVTPLKDLATAFNFIVGPEQPNNDSNYTYLFDVTATYTGIKALTLGLTGDFAAAANDPFLVSNARSSTTARWYGMAGFVAYDFLERFRAALRQEWFRDEEGARTGTPGGVTLFGTTATLQYNIWKGLFSRLEYRHDSANQAVWGCPTNGSPAAGTCRNKAQDTISMSLYYKFF